MDEWTIGQYETSSGRFPVKEFILDQTEDDQESIFSHIQELKELNIKARPPLVKHISGKLWELRIRTGKQFRIFYFTQTRKQIILLHGFIKKTQKAPLKEIELAKNRMNELL